MGPSGPPLATLCRREQQRAPLICHCPAVTLADQEKAFERIGHAWRLRPRLRTNGGRAHRAGPWAAPPPREEHWH
eukprot:10002585-Lingulodinium_polyedra.AAC.1